MRLMSKEVVGAANPHLTFGNVGVIEMRQEMETSFGELCKKCENASFLF